MTVDPSTNGHAPSAPAPSAGAAMRALQTRLQVMRQTVTAREDEIDYVNAMHMTACEERDALAQENSGLKARIAELEAQTADKKTPAVVEPISE